MKAYKGFNKNEDRTISCLGFVYEVGKTYKHEGNIEICKRGFHACHELHQCWQFYVNNGNNVFYEVECGGEIIESEFDDGKFVCSEITLVREIDVSDVELFSDSSYFCNGFAIIRKNGYSNLIDTEGRRLSDYWFDYAWTFVEDFAVVRKGKEYNHIGMDGKLLSDEGWLDAFAFQNGYARVVRKDGKQNNIDKQGKTVSDEWFDYMSCVYDGKAKVMQDGNYYMFNVNTKTMEPFEL